MIPFSVVPEIAELQKDVPEGHCAFCEDAIPDFLQARRPPVHCGSHECEKSYHRLYRRARTQKNWDRGLNANGGGQQTDPRSGKRRAE